MKSIKLVNSPCTQVFAENDLLKSVNDVKSLNEDELNSFFTTDSKNFNSPLVTKEEEKTIREYYNAYCHDNLYTDTDSNNFNDSDVWIQTYSGKKFNPLNPSIESIDIEDIAHALSMQCRFSGHSHKFHSVAHHSVLVSYICNFEDALYGLLHDASEAYLVDIPSPLKKYSKFNIYVELEKNMMKVICKKFGLPETEPNSVKRADKLLLATEARDLLNGLHKDWVQPCDPLPFKIETLSQEDAKALFMKRFFELTMLPSSY